MKKNLFVKVVLSSLVLLLAVGCGKQEDNKKDDAAQSNAEKQQVIRVGTSASYNPWAFQEDDKLKGFEIDVWNEIAKRENYKLEFKLGQFSGLVGMLDAGEIDTVAHQISITPEREEKYYFSAPYAYSYYDLFVKDDSSYKTLDDLKGKKVGCWLGGNGEKTCREINDKYHMNWDIVTYDGVPMEEELKMGRVDAIWQGEIKTLAVIKKNKLPIRQINQKLVYEVNAYPFRKDDAGKEMSEKVSKAIDEMRKDGTLSKLSEKWFDVDITKKEQ